MSAWPEPGAGDIVWCHFPDHIHPRAKPRPGLILAVFHDQNTRCFVSIAYGTSQKTRELYRGEFRIGSREQAAAYELAGLSHDIKFNVGLVLELPYDDQYFSVPPHAPHGQIPKMGTLHPSLVRIAAAAYAAVQAAA